MNKPKSNKGITLVALIITVIVLLILTVVAIRAITGEGVLDKAKTATNSYEDKRREEENMLVDYAGLIDENMPQNTIGGDTTLENLNQIFKNKTVMETVVGTEEAGLGCAVEGTTLTLVDGTSMKIKDNLTENNFIANTELELGGILVTYNNEAYTIVYGANEEYDYTNFTFNSSYSSFYGINPVILRIEKGHNIIGNAYIR